MCWFIDSQSPIWVIIVFVSDDKSLDIMQTDVLISIKNLCQE